MIINGGSRSNAAWFTKHLTNAKDNERVRLCEIKGLAATTVEESFKEMAAVASVTQCKNWFYHANINPRAGEILTDEQWHIAVDTLESNLSLSGHARFVIEHKKNDRVHRHVIWSRIDVDRMRAVPMTDDYEKHQSTSRRLERQFNLEPETSVLDRHRKGLRPERRPENWEVFRGKRSGIDPQTVKNDVMSLWASINTGKDFAAALKTKGYTLARGDLGNYCIIDKAGDSHSLARRLPNIKAYGLKEFMKDVKLKSLPSVTQARNNVRGIRNKPPE